MRSVLEIIGIVAIWCIIGYVLVTAAYVIGSLTARDLEFEAFASGLYWGLTVAIIYVGSTILYFIIN